MIHEALVHEQNDLVGSGDDCHLGGERGGIGTGEATEIRLRVIGHRR
jgi:hypothetical protein